MTGRNLTLGSLRELGTVGLVAGLCGTYAAALIMTSTILVAMSSSDDGGAAAGVLLSVVAGVFILIALYVAAVVIVNAVDTVVSGRLRHIALLRLLGASGRDLRRSVVRGTVTVGAAGATAGLVEIDLPAGDLRAQQLAQPACGYRRGDRRVERFEPHTR